MLKLIKTAEIDAMLRPGIDRTLGTGDTWGVIVTSCTRHNGLAANRSWASQANYALNFVLVGTGRLEPAEGPALPLGPGAAYQHFPAPVVAPKLVWDANQEVVEWFVTLDRRLYERLAVTGFFPTDYLLNFSHPDPAGIFATFYEHIQPIGRQPGQRRLHFLLAETMHFLGRLFDSATAPEPAGRWPALVNEARDWLDLNPASRAPLPRLARRLGVSYPSLRREFQKAVGQSLNSYRIARRIEAAKGRLIHDDVASTAAALGYPDPFTFSAQFKKVTGQAPRSYRRGERLANLP
jgi:hypothetical protein